MLFNSFRFLIFFPVVTAVYFLIPYRFRWMWLLAASYYFYMCWRWQYTVLLVIATLVDYAAGLGMAATRDPVRRRLYLFFSIISNLGLLCYFKYFNFLTGSLTGILQLVHSASQIPVRNIVLPVGISFHTFQGLGYSIDVYRGERKPERHLGIFALFIAFFPQMVAGPIERATHMIPQFYRPHDFEYQRVTDGFKLMAWGFFKKLVIADTLASVVDSTFRNPESVAPFQLLTAVYYFAFQIYCDFSGYTDIARGGAQVLGFQLTYNFNRPYFSQSIPEFWHRWHISLSSWFRDYVYIPLGGNRVAEGRWLFNILATFALSGLWHGANWTYVIWGVLHGTYYVVSVLTRNLRQKVVSGLGLIQFPRALALMRIFIAFHMVLLAWIFFRASNVHQAVYIVRRLWEYGELVATSLVHRTFGLSLFAYRPKPVEITALLAIAVMETMHWLQGPRQGREIINQQPAWLRWPCYVGLVLATLLCGTFETRQFIYFQF